MMKRYLIVGLILLLAAGALALNPIPQVRAAKATPTDTPRPTRDRTRQLTRQATRSTRTATPKPTQQRPTATPESSATPEPPSQELEASDDSGIEIAPASPGAMTSQILLFNPDTSGTATVQIDIYDGNGAVASTILRTVSANGAMVVNLPDTLGADFQGGAQISSDKNVQAIVLSSNGNKTARDSYEGTLSPGTDVTLPFLRHLTANTQSSLVAIQNTSGSSAALTVTLYDQNGGQARQQNVNVAAHRSLYLDTNTLFPSSQFLGSARITANQNIAVAAQTLYYKDTAAYRGILRSEADTSVFLNPVERKLNSAGVPVNWSEIFARNNGAGATDITLELHALNGAVVGSQTANTVPANGLAQFRLQDSDYNSIGNNFRGWAKVYSSGEPLAVASLDMLNKGSRMVGLNGTANKALASRFVCGDMSRLTTENSELTLLNTDPSRVAKTVVRLYNKDTGALIVKGTFKVQPNNATTVLLSDAAFAPAGTNYEGMGLVHAKGAAPPRIIVSVNNPFGSPKFKGTTGYACSQF